MNEMLIAKQRNLITIIIIASSKGARECLAYACLKLHIASFSIAFLFTQAQMQRSACMSGNTSCTQCTMGNKVTSVLSATSCTLHYGGLPDLLELWDDAADGGNLYVHTPIPPCPNRSISAYANRPVAPSNSKADIFGSKLRFLVNLWIRKAFTITLSCFYMRQQLSLLYGDSWMRYFSTCLPYLIEK